MTKRHGQRRRSMPLLLALFFTAPLAAGSAGPESLTFASTATPINRAHVVRGDDGRDHVEYDLLVTNAFGGNVTLSAVDVIDSQRRARCMRRLAAADEHRRASRNRVPPFLRAGGSRGLPGAMPPRPGALSNP